MSFKDCIGRAVNAGEMDKARAERILREYENAFQAMRQNMGHTQADVEAARLVVKRARQEAFETRRRHQLQAAASARHVERMRNHESIRGELSPGDYLQDVISNRRGAQGSTLSGRYEAVRRELRGELTDAAREFRANLVGGRRNKARLESVTRAIFGEKTDDALAGAIAQTWARVAERARTRFNAAGGHIGARSDWGLPQAHDGRKVRAAAYEDWRASILPRLDLDGMGAEFNDGLPFTEDTLEVLLRDAYEAIRTEGLSRRSPSSAGQGKALYNRRADHRFFKFKSADDWMAYNKEFGAGEDAFRIMIGHLDNMAQDIALMEELGPNPNVTWRYLNDAASIMAARTADAGALDKVTRKARQAQHMMDLFQGVTNVPQNRVVARGAAALRNYLTSAHLGSAVISSITDFNTQRIASAFVGMERLGSTRMLARLAASPELRAQASEAGLIFENAVNVGNAVARYELEDLHIEGAARLADFTVRSSGLGWLTEVQRQAFGMEFMREAAKWKGQAWDALDPKTQRAFESYGIGKVDWPAIQRAETHDARGVTILRHQEIEKAGGRDLADRYLETMASLQEFAVPSTDLFGRAQVLGRTQPGSLSGEAARFGMQFKAFPITIMVTQISRIIAEAQAGRSGSALSYGAGLMIGGALFGALAIQLKEIAKGRDPRDMSSKAFWMAALAQGGGAGIFGDFVFTDQNRFGGSLGETLAGPGVGFMGDALKFTLGNAQEAIQGEDTKIGREFTDMLRRYTPGGSLWYLRLAYEREVLDQLQQVLDPQAHRSFRRRARSARDFDTDYFAAPGRGISGARAPDLANAFGG
jgi:hypothetical protein